MSNLAYRPEHFAPSELLPPSVLNQNLTEPLWLMGVGLLRLIDATRRHFGVPMYINTWDVNWADTNFKYRGFRPQWTDVGGDLSQHRLGRAADFNLRGVPVKEARDEIVGNTSVWQERGLGGVGFYSEQNFIHIDTRPTQELLVFRDDFA